MFFFVSFFFLQAEDGIRDLVRSRGLGDVYKRQPDNTYTLAMQPNDDGSSSLINLPFQFDLYGDLYNCLLYTSDAADERSSVDLGGRRIIKKKSIRRYDDKS